MRFVILHIDSFTKKNLFITLKVDFKFDYFAIFIHFIIILNFKLNLQDHLFNFCLFCFILITNVFWLINILIFIILIFQIHEFQILILKFILHSKNVMEHYH